MKSLKYPLFLALFELFSCQMEKIVGPDPCDERIELDAVKPLASNLSAVPYRKEDQICFFNTNKSLKFEVLDYGIYNETNPQQVDVPCQSDSLKQQKLLFSEGAYISSLNRISGNAKGIKSIEIKLVRYYEGPDPRDNRNADVLEISVISDLEINGNYFHTCLSFPLSSHNYNSFIQGLYEYSNGIYSSKDGLYPFKIDYSIKNGLVGFTDLDGQYWKR